uniref:hypothetical protein n=1 Tax=Deinococcus sp. TaxID=47478 RepID=UPI0025C157AD
LEDFCAWPTMSLHNSANEVTGFLMAQVNTSEFRPVAQLYARDLQANSQSSSQNRPQNGWPGTWAFRIQVGSRLAQAFAVFHEAGQVIGNVNDQHALVSPQGQVKLIGADSFQVNTPQETFAARTGLLQFTPPELQAGGIATQQRTPDHDHFGLAVLIFRLLFGGRHPYSGVPVGRRMPGPGEAIASDAYAYAQQPRPYVKAPPGVYGSEVLPPALRNMFERAFGQDHHQRPDARQWQTALSDLALALVPCDQNAQHERIPGRPCPRCEVATATAEPTAKPTARTDSPGAVQRLWQQAQDTPPPDRLPAVPDIPDSQCLPPLALNLPPRPRSVIAPHVQETVLRWVLRLLTLAAVMTVVGLIQKSVLAAVLEVGLVVFALTLGRRFSVDWDGIIDGFQNAEGRFITRLTPTKGQWQTYHAAVAKRRDEVRKRFQELQDEYARLESRYSEETVYAQYQQELLELDQQRRLLQGAPQGDTVRQMIEQEASEALNEYLKRQAIAPNTVPGLSSRTALHLTTMGVRRASDVQTDKLKVVRSDFADELINWRTGLVQFFHFNPDNIPAAKLEAARQQGQTQNSAAFRQFDQRVRRFAGTDWRSKENTIVEQLRGLKAQAKQYQNALKELDEQSKQ